MMLADQVRGNFLPFKNLNKFIFQIIAAPLLNAAMIAYLPLVNGKSFDEIKLRFLLVK